MMLRFGMCVCATNLKRPVRATGETRFIIHQTPCSISRTISTKYGQRCLLYGSFSHYSDVDLIDTGRDLSNNPILSDIIFNVSKNDLRGFCYDRMYNTISVHRALMLNQRRQSTLILLFPDCTLPPSTLHTHHIWLLLHTCFTHTQFCSYTQANTTSHLRGVF